MQIFMKNKLLVGGAGGMYEILWVHLQGLLKDQDLLL